MSCEQNLLFRNSDSTIRMERKDFCLYSLGLLSKNGEVFHNSFTRIEKGVHTMNVFKGMHVRVNEMVGEVTSIWENKEIILCELKLLCKPEHTKEGIKPYHGSSELLRSPLVVEVPSSSILSVCKVKSLEEYMEDKEYGEGVYYYSTVNGSVFKQNELHLIPLTRGLISLLSFTPTKKKLLEDSLTLQLSSAHPYISSLMKQVDYTEKSTSQSTLHDTFYQYTQFIFSVCTIDQFHQIYHSNSDMLNHYTPCIETIEQLLKIAKMNMVPVISRLSDQLIESLKIYPHFHSYPNIYSHSDVICDACKSPSSSSKRLVLFGTRYKYESLSSRSILKEYTKESGKEKEHIVCEVCEIRCHLFSKVNHFKYHFIKELSEYNKILLQGDFKAFDLSHWKGEKYVDFLNLILRSSDYS